ncbi:hypothetical protein [Thermosipho atlanticus]|uniref:Outer membrane lipoprotein-sorting protein n=1 Tax=Thermosipho atlanticus DSM 15807 TaxID=1123380 RepID=A0A1M5QZF2_9BACT|nr:hypothetical protein [Thermosipho atlanticus]SHH19311.1 hypothetical protein SAMN02745199_0239 [Thermosipho atlanticus DSM 15807]
MNIKKLPYLLTLIFILISSISFSEPLIFNFIKSFSGKRDFFISTEIIFDVMDEQKSEFHTNISLEATIINLEKFTVKFLAPEFLKDIEIEFNALNNISVFKYQNNTNSEVSNYTIDSIYEIFKTASDFLSSSVFRVSETKNGLIFSPTGYPFLKRLGLEPTKINITLTEDGFDEIVFSTDDSTETVTIKFKQFKILDIN